MREARRRLQERFDFERKKHEEMVQLFFVLYFNIFLLEKGRKTIDF